MAIYSWTSQGLAPVLMMVGCMHGEKIERFKNCCVAEHVHFGGCSIMNWGGISYYVCTEHYVITNGLGVGYRDEILAQIV